MVRLDDAQKAQVRDLLARLIAIPSAVASIEQANRDRAEEGMARFLGEHLRGMGMAVEYHEVFPGRRNLMARWPGQGSSGRSLMLEAHMDTVPVEGMTIDPFGAVVRDGRMYGRGACDTKGSMAAFLAALAIARQRDALPADTVYFVSTVSEETGCDGAAALMTTPFRTDAAIVGEATGCRVVTAHKGPLWLTVETHGRACHASMPDHGVNAIAAMGRVIDFVHGPWQDYLRAGSHPLLGRSTSTVTTIEGGTKINVIPARCRIQVDTRLIPGRPREAVLADFKRMLGEYLGDPAAFTIRDVTGNPQLDTPVGLPLVRRLLEVCRRAHGHDRPAGVNYFADSGPFSEAGIASVIFGPGDIAQAHTADEYLELEQLYLATEMILTLLTEHAGRSIVSE
ncbi:MAG: M20/M25/M40 family metallo-hydrolase [Phycisphaerae bacterium]|jgi:acetylornithine deacetylase